MLHGRNKFSDFTNPFRRYFVFDSKVSHNVHHTYLMLIGTQWQRFIKMSAYIIEINKFQLANAHAKNNKKYLSIYCGSILHKAGLISSHILKAVRARKQKNLK